VATKTTKKVKPDLVNNFKTRMKATPTLTTKTTKQNGIEGIVT
jgi:hypothetical protein